MTMQPCRTCYMADDCEIREKMRHAVRGLGLASIKFKCSKLTDSLPPGTQVEARLRYVAYGFVAHGFDDGAEVLTKEQTVPAIVMGWSRGKVRIYVPYASDSAWWLQQMRSDSKRAIHVLCVTPGQLKPTDKPLVSVCLDCGLPEMEDPLEGWNCGEDGCRFAAVRHG